MLYVYEPSLPHVIHLVYFNWMIMMKGNGGCYFQNSKFFKNTFYTVNKSSIATFPHSKVESSRRHVSTSSEAALRQDIYSAIGRRCRINSTKERSNTTRTTSASFNSLLRNA